MLTRYDRQGRLNLRPWHRDPVWHFVLCGIVAVVVTLAGCRACDEMPLPCTGPACEVVR